MAEPSIPGAGRTAAGRPPALEPDLSLVWQQQSPRAHRDPKVFNTAAEITIDLESKANVSHIANFNAVVLESINVTLRFDAKAKAKAM